VETTKRPSKPKHKPYIHTYIYIPTYINNHKYITVDLP
jgi:hypothetical protein